MKLSHILSLKSSVVFSIHPEATLAEMVESLVKHNCGSLVVLRETQMVGIITERDTLKSYVATKKGLDELCVCDFMTKEVITGLPEDGVAETMGLMTSQRIRHLPILNEQGDLQGMISIGDLVKAQHDQLTVDNHFMKSYIQS